jgi:hypothetical protein
MNDDLPAANRDGQMGQVVGLLQVIIGLLIVIAIVLLVILARGPEDQERSGAWLPVAVTLLTA